MAYRKGVSLVSGPDFAWFQYLADDIQTHYVGPDCYWKNPAKDSIPGCTRHFGNAWWIPFPPTLVRTSSGESRFWTSVIESITGHQV